MLGQSELAQGSGSQMVCQQALDELVLEMRSFNALIALELCYRQQFADVRRAFSKGLAKLRTHLSCTKQQVGSQIP